MINLIEDMRKEKFEDEIVIEDSELDYLNGLNQNDEETIQHVHKLLLELIAVYKVRSTVLDIVSAIELEKAKTVNEPIEPIFDSRSYAKEVAKKAEIIPDYEWN
jgi:hypothetical protein